MRDRRAALTTTAVAPPALQVGSITHHSPRPSRVTVHLVQQLLARWRSRRRVDLKTSVLSKHIFEW